MLSEGFSEPVRQAKEDGLPLDHELGACAESGSEGLPEVQSELSACGSGGRWNSGMRKAHRAQPAGPRLPRGTDCVAPFAALLCWLWALLRV